MKVGHLFWYNKIFLYLKNSVKECILLQSFLSRRVEKRDKE